MERNKMEAAIEGILFTFGEAVEPGRRERVSARGMALPSRKNGEWYFTLLKTTARKDAASAYEPKNDPLNDLIKPKEKDK